jgi:hypothetical protein
VQALERGARLDPEVRDERAPRVPVGGERLGLPAVAVERKHELSPQALPQRLAGDRGLELGDDLGVPPQRQVGVDAPLVRDQALLIEPGGFGARPRLAAEVAQCRAAPHGERLAQRLCGAVGLTGGEGAPAVVEEALEAGRVDRLVREHELVGMLARAQRIARGQRPAQLRDEVVHDLRRGRRCVTGPELLDDPIAGNRVVALQDEQGEQGALAASAEGHRAPIVEHFQRTEDADVHVAPERA